MISKILLLVSLFAGIGSAQVADCAAGKGVFTINSQDFAPNPPIVGQNATLWIDYTVPEGIEVNSGTAKYSISLNGIPFSPSTDDLCTQISCPQEPGTYNVTSTSMWNGGVSGKIVSKIQWYDGTGALLLCSQTTMRVSSDEYKMLRGFRDSRIHNSWMAGGFDSSDSSSISSSSGSTSSSSTTSSSGSNTSSSTSPSSSSSGSTSSSTRSSGSSTHTSSSRAVVLHNVQTFD